MLTALGLSGGVLAERCRKGGLQAKAIREGMATIEEFEQAALAWEEWVRTEDACLGMMHGEILIEK